MFKQHQRSSDARYPDWNWRNWVFSFISSNSNLTLWQLFMEKSNFTSGLAASLISSEVIFRADTLHEGMVLYYSTKCDMSAASLCKLTKIQMLFPVDIEELIHSLQGLHVLTNLFLKKNCYVSQGFQKLVNFCVDDMRLIRIRIHVDSKFICAVQEIIYLCLQ